MENKITRIQTISKGFNHLYKVSGRSQEGNRYRSWALYTSTKDKEVLLKIVNDIYKDYNNEEQMKNWYDFCRKTTKEMRNVADKITYQIQSIKRIGERHNCYENWVGYETKFKILDLKKGKFRRLNYIETYDVCDICEYFEKDRVSKKEIEEFAKENIINFLESYLPEDLDKSEEIINVCKESVQKWNRLVA